MTAPPAPPLISVVVPAHDAAAFLPRTLESILAQTGVDREVIVVDDGSGDDTPRLLEEYRARGVRVFRQPASGGPARPRNVGLREARGELVALCDADDVMLPGKLAAAAAVFAQLPEIDLLFTDFQAVDPEDRIIRPPFLSGYDSFRPQFRPTPLPRVSVGRGRDLHRALLLANFVGTSSVVARRAALLDAGGFDESLRNSDDRDMWFKLARAGRVFACLDEIHHHYRVHPASLSRRVTHRLPSVITVLERQLSAVDDTADRALLRRRIHGARLAYAWGLRREGRHAEAAAQYRRCLRERPTLRGAAGLARTWAERLLGRSRSA